MAELDVAPCACGHARGDHKCWGVCYPCRDSETAEACEEYRAASGLGNETLRDKIANAVSDAYLTAPWPGYIRDEDLPEGVTQLTIQRDCDLHIADVVLSAIAEWRGPKERGRTPSGRCEHPAPVWVTALSDPMPTWHCSGCDRIFRGDPEEIRAAEARGREWAVQDLDEARAEIEHLRELLADAEERFVDFARKSW